MVSNQPTFLLVLSKKSAIFSCFCSNTVHLSAEVRARKGSQTAKKSEHSEDDAKNRRHAECSVMVNLCRRASA